MSDRVPEHTFATKPLSEQCDIVRDLERRSIASYLRKRAAFYAAKAASKRGCSDLANADTYMRIGITLRNEADDIETAAHHVH